MKRVRVLKIMMLLFKRTVICLRLFQKSKHSYKSLIFYSKDDDSEMQECLNDDVMQYIHCMAHYVESMI